MKKLVFILFLVFFVLGTPCFSQSYNDAQRIVGTWKAGFTNEKGTFSKSYTFNSNGTFILTEIGTGQYASSQSDVVSGSYFINGSKLIITYDSFNALELDFYLSSNGRILYISFMGSFYDPQWFEKQ